MAGGPEMVKTLDRPMADISVAAVVDDRLERLKKAYVWRTGDDVESHLRHQPLLIDALIEARPVIADYFGAETPVQLEVTVDPYTIGVEDLTAVILSSFDE